MFQGPKAVYQAASGIKGELSLWGGSMDSNSPKRLAEWQACQYIINMDWYTTGTKKKL